MEITTPDITKQNNCTASKIFEKARQLFNRIGVRNTTMDDLAKELGISKKTLYKEIDNKADLVKFCVQYDLKEIENKIAQISNSCENAIEELLLIGASINEDLQLYHPTILHDIEKFYPESRQLIEQHKSTFAQKSISTNLKKGIKQGLYRKDINIEMFTMFQLHLCLLPFQLSNSNYKTRDVYNEILAYNLYAIATPKGIEEFQQLIKKIKL
ncbi:MAG: TetR/AcrR family transcriptional regulator [Chitinophagales bacterium]